MLNTRPETIQRILNTVNKIKKIANSNLLDLCCGEGYLVNAANKNGANAFGIDIIDNKSISGKSNFFIGDFLKYDFGDQKFDIIICNMSFAYFYDSIAAIKKVYNLLNPSGIFFMKQKSIYYLYILSIKKLITALNTTVFPHDYFLGGAKAMKILFEKGGFKKINVSGLDDNTVQHLRKSNNKFKFLIWYLFAKFNMYGMLNVTGYK